MGNFENGGITSGLQSSGQHLSALEPNGIRGAGGTGKGVH